MHEEFKRGRSNNLPCGNKHTVIIDVYYLLVNRRYTTYINNLKCSVNHILYYTVHKIYIIQ